MVFRTASAIATLLIGLGGAGGQGLAQDYPPAHAIRRARDPTDLYQNSQTLTHAAGVLPGLPFPKRAELQLDMGAALRVDAGANESTSPQVGIDGNEQCSTERRVQIPETIGISCGIL